MHSSYSDPSLQAHHDRVYYTKLSGAPQLPDGVDEQRFSTIVTELKQAVGDSNVITGADLSNFEDPYPFDEQNHRPSAAVWLALTSTLLCVGTRTLMDSSPQTTEEIQAILSIANNHRFPLWTTSRGKNFGSVRRIPPFSIARH